MYADRELRGIVVSTAKRFSPDARDLAGTVNGAIELVDRGKLNLLLSSLIPQKPWESVFEYYEGGDSAFYERAIEIMTENILIHRGELTRVRDKTERLRGRRRPIADLDIAKLRAHIRSQERKAKPNEGS